MSCPESEIRESFRSLPVSPNRAENPGKNRKGSAAKAGRPPGTFLARGLSESVSPRAPRGNFGKSSKDLRRSEESRCQGLCTSRYGCEVWEVVHPTASWALPPSVLIVPEFRSWSRLSSCVPTCRDEGSLRLPFALGVR